MHLEYSLKIYVLQSELLPRTWIVTILAPKIDDILTFRQMAICGQL